jgi:hypothetical protein
VNVGLPLKFVIWKYFCRLIWNPPRTLWVPFTRLMLSVNCRFSSSAPIAWEIEPIPPSPAMLKAGIPNMMA